MTWRGAFTSPQGSCLCPKAVCARRSELTPTLSHPWPRLAPHSLWPAGRHGQWSPTWAAGEDQPAAFEHHVPFHQAPWGWSSDSGSFESPRALSHTRPVTVPRPGMVGTPHWVHRPWLHDLKCGHSPERCLAPNPPHSALLKDKLRHTLLLRTRNSFCVA